MQLSISDAHQLAARVMRALGHDSTDAERIGRHGDGRPIRMVMETPISARLDGGDHIGYVVAHRATGIAIEKAEAAGIAVVGASDTARRDPYPAALRFACRSTARARSAKSGSPKMPSRSPTPSSPG